ncbi:LysR family transcriptional regulator [Burkholderia pseudomallei]|nr:LysR family transcriptional regulator [Burkholderia pseudomallei]VBT10698.1 LysR family transcriptional regulator [Burkholderia pseudomallei]
MVRMRGDGRAVDVSGFDVHPGARLHRVDDEANCERERRRVLEIDDRLHADAPGRVNLVHPRDADDERREHGRREPHPDQADGAPSGVNGSPRPGATRPTSTPATSEGETYLGYATRIVADIRRMADAVRASRSVPRGLLRVNVMLGFGRTTITPLVSEFATPHPRVEVRLDVTDRPVDRVDGGFDFAIRFGEPPDTRLNARRIMSNRRLLRASPVYLQRRGAPASLARCIVHRRNDDAHGVWRFVRDGEAEGVKVRAAPSSNDGDIVPGWALDGHGILIRSEWDLAKYLESGRLRRVLPEYALPSADLFACYPVRRNPSARARAPIDFLVARLGASAPAPARTPKGGRRAGSRDVPPRVR